MTVLVTGGLGYIGSRLIRDIPGHASTASETVRILDNRRQPRIHSLWDLPAIADYQLVDADIRDTSAVVEAMTDVDTVFHLAAVTNASETFDIPDETRAVNYDGTRTVFNAARQADVTTFVNVSTCSVYGSSDTKLVEGDPCNPDSPYGKAKLDAESAILETEADGISTTSLRLGTVHGWTRGMRFDTVVDKFAYLGATGQPLTVYEDAQDQKRPYLHVQDAVNAMLFAAGELDDSRVYNVVGQNLPLRDVVAGIRDQFPDIKVDHIENEILDQTSYIVDDERIRTAGFTPSHTVEQGIQELADKFRGLTPHHV